MYRQLYAYMHIKRVYAVNVYLSGTVLYVANVTPDSNILYVANVTPDSNIGGLESRGLQRQS